MVRRGYKACPHCTSEIPVACRTCPNCNAGVRGDTRSTTAAVSPVQCGRLLRFKRVPLGSPDRSRSVRNHAGRSGGFAQRAQQNRDRQNSAEDQNQSSSGHQLEDLGGNSTAVSPVAHGRLTNSDGGILSAYVNQLKIDQNRYLSVAQDEHGVVCYAVAGHVLGPGGSVSISARASQHVLALPMLHTADERHYSYLCSCEDMKPGIQVLTGLDSITSPKATWDKTAGRCLHSKAIEALRGNEDSIIISDLEDNALYRRIDEEVVLDSGEPVFIINPSSGTNFLLSVALEAGHPRSFVGADSAGHLKCLACKSKDCQHCRFVHSWVEEQDGGEWDMAEVFEGISLQGESSHSEPAVPSMTLPIQRTRLPPDYCSTALASRSLGAGQFFQGDSLSKFSGGCMHLVPGLHGCCSICQSVWSESDPMQAGWVALSEGCVYGLSGCHPAKVYFRRCSNGGCPGVLQYDGHCDGIFNYSNRSLFTYEVCFSYADGMVVSRLPFATHWQLLKRNYARGGHFGLLCSRGTHRRAMLEFIKLIDVDYRKSFTCSTCAGLQHNELVFIIDGKEMGMNRALSKPYVPPLSPDEEPVPVQCPHARTVPFPSQAGRTLLNRWVAAVDRKGEVLSVLGGDDFEELLLYADKLPGLDQALQGVLDRYPEDATVRSQCPLEMRPLFKCIAKNYPTSGMLAPVYASGALRRLIRGQDRAISGSRKRALAEGFPALHTVVSSCRWAQLPADLLPMLEVLTTKACFPTQCPEVGGEIVTNAAAESDHVFMPAFPLCRDLPTFHANSDKVKDGERCSKYHRLHNQLTPGIFTVFCAHGICVGFKFMVNKEGPATAFDLFFSRLITGPKMVVYDNACNLHRYALRRAPKFFAETAFRIDRLHIYNHNGCSSGYNLAKYPQDMQVVDGVRLRTLNTQVAEQCNSILDRVRTQVAYMHHDNGMVYLKYFLACSNEMVRNR